MKIIIEYKDKQNRQQRKVVDNLQDLNKLAAKLEKEGIDKYKVTKEN